MRVVHEDPMRSTNGQSGVLPRKRGSGVERPSTWALKRFAVASIMLNTFLKNAGACGSRSVSLNA